MTLFLNGQAREIQRSGTIEELLSEIGLPAHSILIEHNGLALHRAEWPNRSLAEGDRIEIVRIVAGG